MKNLYGIFLIVLAVALIAGSQSLFTVDQREQAIVLQLGQPIGEVRQPGLHFKIPFVQDVRRFDSRILSVDPEPEQMVISSSNDSPLVKSADPNIIVPKTDTSNPEIVSGEPIIVDAFARYRINDPLMFMKTLRTVGAANQRIENIMNESTRSVLGQTTMRDLLSTERSTVMHDILNRVNKKIETDQLGVDVIDVRIVRADLTPALRQSTVQRMISVYDMEEREERAIALMESLRMIVTQALVPKVGGGRVGVREWMKFPDEVREKLMDMSFTKWPNEIQRMINQYGQTMERSAEIVYEDGKIDRIHYLYLASSTGA